MRVKSNAMRPADISARQFCGLQQQAEPALTLSGNYSSKTTNDTDGRAAPAPRTHTIRMANSAAVPSIFAMAHSWNSESALVEGVLNPFIVANTGPRSIS